MMTNEDIYWALETGDDLATALHTRMQEYRDHLEGRGVLADIRRSRLAYQGRDSEGGGHQTSGVGFSGESGELVVLKSNQYRSLIRLMLSLTTSARQAYDAVARDDSAASMEAVQLAEQLFDHHLDNGVEDAATEGGERMLVDYEAAFLAGWNPYAGRLIGERPVTGPDGEPIGLTPVFSGEFEYELMSGHDVARDVACRDLRKLPWVICLRRKSRWDLLAQYPEPELGHAIRGADGIRGDAYSRGELRPHDGYGQSLKDTVHVLEFYHARTPAVPEGRYARVIGDKVLEEGPLPYPRIPVVLGSPSQLIDEAIGRSDAWDLLGLARMYDAVLSDQATISNAFGRPILRKAKGTDFDTEDLEGMALLEFDAGPDTPPPEFMDLPKIDPSALRFMELLKNDMQLLSGANSAVRGDPDNNLKSGVSVRLVASMAVQANSLFQKEFAQWLRGIGSLIVMVYQAMATEDQVIQVTKHRSRRAVRRFTGADLDGVMGIAVDLANPLTRTVEGRVAYADTLRDPASWPADKPLTRAQYDIVVSTGRTDILDLGGEEAELRGILEENEMLLRGVPVQAGVWERHQLHAEGHLSLLRGAAKYELSDAVQKAIIQHVLEHDQLALQPKPGAIAMGEAGGPGPGGPGAAMGPPPMGPPLPAAAAMGEVVAAAQGPVPGPLPGTQLMAGTAPGTGTPPPSGF